EYGDERRAKSIARAIVTQRQTQPIRTTTQLRSLVHRCYRGVSHAGGIDSATRTFLALRIAVNRELESLREGLDRAWEILAPGGTQVMISFQSGEHRLIKQFLRRRLGQCICPPGMPACGCGAKVEGRLLVRRAITPGPQELARNPRSRSAQLRAIQRLPQEVGREPS
ncbi:MAG: 16S rRNA (cytosine(1402)-N(4))-methyltransferase, partial [Nitrospinota bacterium]